MFCCVHCNFKNQRKMARKEDLLLLFDRPREPVFMEKGKENAVFDIPHNFFTDRYKLIGDEIQSRFGMEAERRIPVRNISIPNLQIPMSLGRNESFSLFIPRHRLIAGHLISIFAGLRTVDDLISVAAYARDRLNPYLFNYALSVAILHRSDTKRLNLPSFVQLFPEKFMDSKVMNRIREEASIVNEDLRMPIIIPKDYTASDLNEEHRVWYFREDIGANLHHWHWHLVYPFEADREDIVRKDRRGELFYYMHQQLVARYNCERFCNSLARTKRFNNLREPIVEGYFPKMDSLVASRAWPPRFDNTRLMDLDRELDQIKLDISDLERWRDRVFEAIHQGYVVDESGNRVELDEVRGIDVLGDIIESSIISLNRQLYGDFHNMGHVFISYAHDPNHHHLESFGVMGDSATAMRDPVFYRWHSYIDDIFQEHKEILTPYTTEELGFQGIIIRDLNVETQNSPPNTFQTFWQESDIDLSRGLDFVPRGSVFARFTHLQHLPWTYVMNVTNNDILNRLGTARIFLGPRFDERDTEMLFRDQRLLMIELDKFVVSLRPGNNIVRRSSASSSVTIPFERTFRDLDANRPEDDTPELEGFNFCGCGWPQHLLIPKGKPEGLTFELFAMITDYQADRIDESLVGSCSDAVSYCGIRDRKYPDRKAMGFPFDRLPRSGADRLDTFLTRNMIVREVNIVFTDRTETRSSVT